MAPLKHVTGAEGEGRGPASGQTAAGETPDQVVDGAACLCWLGELAAGQRRWQRLAGLPPAEATALKARLSLLLDLWGRA